MVLSKLAQSPLLDFFKPAYYKVEKKVASQQIPAVHEIPNRKKLSDFTSKANVEDVMDHAVWDALLKQYVNTDASNTIGDVTGIHLVDYAGIGADPQFEAYLQTLAITDPSTLTEPEQLAFWMNAYNAFCISLLVNAMKKNNEEEPQDLQSINDLSKPNLPVWDLPAGTVGGEHGVVSLNYVEHEQLRKVWAEPAVHACIVCASASCPNLRAEAFVGSRVREQMDDQVRLWLQNDSKGFRYDGKTLFLSRIFLWFADDFGGWNGGLQEWLAQYLKDNETGGIQKQLAANKIKKVRYFEYSWKMNRLPQSDGTK